MTLENANSPLSYFHYTNKTRPWTCKMSIRTWCGLTYQCKYAFVNGGLESETAFPRRCLSIAGRAACVAAAPWTWLLNLPLLCSISLGVINTCKLCFPDSHRFQPMGRHQTKWQKKMRLNDRRKGKAKYSPLCSSPLLSPAELISTEFPQV